MNGCLTLSESIEFVTIHDIVRPFVTNDLILSTILGCNNNDGCIAALLSNDTGGNCSGRLLARIRRKSES